MLTLLKWLVFIGLLQLELAYSQLVLGEECDIPTICLRNDSVSTLINDICVNETFRVVNRCCYSNETVVGIDLHDCDIHSLTNKLINYTDLIILGLDNNTNLNCSDDQEYIGLKKLEFLVLPSGCLCPGDWNSTSYHNELLHQIETNQTICEGQVDECLYRNISCTSMGKCFSNGPGIASCECQKGHYGYKCLRQGNFPMVPFSAGITVTTLVLSFLVWFTQRRLVKTM